MAKKKSEEAMSRWQDRLAWGVGFVGLAVFVAVLTIVCVDAFRHDMPAMLEAREMQRRTTPAGVALTVAVRNTGGQPAAGVHLTGESRMDARLTAEADLDHVAGKSRAEATLQFPRDPGPVDLRIVGWARP